MPKILLPISLQIDNSIDQNLRQIKPCWYVFSSSRHLKPLYTPYTTMMQNHTAILLISKYKILLILLDDVPIAGIVLGF